MKGIDKSIVVRWSIWMPLYDEGPGQINLDVYRWQMPIGHLPPRAHRNLTPASLKRAQMVDVARAMGAG